MDPIATPIPNQVPKVLTSMGSVFGSPLTGFNLVSPSSSPTPTTAEHKPAIMPTDVLTQDVMTLQSEVRYLKSQIVEIKEFINRIAPQSSVKPAQPLANPLSGTILDPNPKGVAVIEKKKRGRPKKFQS